MNQSEIIESQLQQADLACAITVLATVKEINKRTGLTTGQFVCPRCHAGTVRWVVAHNGHARAACDRKWTDNEGNEHRCTAVME